MSRAIIFGLAFAAVISAQPTVAPSPEPVGATRGEDHEGYNVLNSFELGYRFRSVGGSLGRYRSDVNYGNGPRLLAGSLAVHHKEGHGRLFDLISLNTQGLGNDPYQMAGFRIEKNRFYRYDLLWRLNDYYNPGLAVAGGQHLHDTVRRVQDHDFTVFPQSSLRFHAGFSRNTQDGPALSTVQQFESRGDEFPLFADIRRTQNEYRAGMEIRMMGVKFSLFRAWEKFSEDTPLRLAGAGAGNSADDLTELTALSRGEPYSGSTPSWRAHLGAERGRWLAVHGRFAYSGGRRDFTFTETATGLDRFGRARDRQISVSGNARRPVTSAALTLSLFPNDRLTVSNHSAFHHVRMEGDNLYGEVNNLTSSFSFLSFRFLGLRTFANATDVNYRARKWLGLYGGYHYSTRRIRSREQTGQGANANLTAAEQDNKLHSGLMGIRLQPSQPLSIRVEAEIGRADRPFFPISERRYHLLGARVQYKTRQLYLSAASHAGYNTNSISLATHSARARTTSFDASWSPRPSFSFDASYSKLHLDTLSGIAFFSAGQLVRDFSVYASDIHSGNLGLRVAMSRRVDLTLGYSRAEDTAVSYPLVYDSPLARLSIRLHNKLRWNAGYQYYRYHENLLSVQNYRAHTGYSSVTWSF